MGINFASLNPIENPLLILATVNMALAGKNVVLLKRDNTEGSSYREYLTHYRVRRVGEGRCYLGIGVKTKMGKPRN